MEALYLLIPLSVVAVFGAAWVFLRMADSGQFEDMDGPAWSVLHDDDRPGGERTDRPGKAPEDAGAAMRERHNRNNTDDGDTVAIDATQDRRVTTQR
ncbi:cbb3-type cytochrome oxidase assembly protein CcoS [Zeimonas sediminis]|uniref:cbb3-type cytochrome oxidase assembly protein CcoS n=1 Tax=Zeimonas sediminis TaxID=2944268 RepID=UPI00300DFC53